MSAVPVTVRKNATGESWSFSRDIDSLPQILEMLPRWGCSIVTEEPATAPSITPTRETEMHVTKARDVIEIAKRALASGGEIPFDRDQLFAAAQRRADKEITAPSAAQRFAKYAETPDGRTMMQAMKVAAPAPAPAAPTSAFEAIARSAADFCRKQGTSLPPNSPYAPFLKETETQGERDAPNDQIVGQMDKYVRNIAQSLVDAGRFSDLATSLRYMRGSSRYAHLFTGVVGRFAEGRRDMLRDGLR